MQAEQFVEKLKNFYTSTFDLEPDHRLGGEVYDVYGHFNVDSSRYVLVKKAKLWEANSQEHLFIRNWKAEEGSLTPEKLQQLIRLSVTQIEALHARQHIQPWTYTRLKVPAREHQCFAPHQASLCRTQPSHLERGRQRILRTRRHILRESVIVQRQALHEGRMIGVNTRMKL